MSNTASPPRPQHRLRALLTVIALALAGIVAVLHTAGAAGATSTTNGPIAASEVFSRAQSWISNPPSGGYNQGGRWNDPQGVAYRTDCSGFVSMALHITAPGLVTSQFPSSSQFAALSSKTQLQPGDIMDAANGAGSYTTGHVVLFAGWVPGTSETSYYGYEFGGGAAPVYHAIPYPYFSNDPRTFLPYHYKNLTSTGTTGFETALQVNTHDLWALGMGGDTDWALGMAAGTSPSIAHLTGGGYEIAFQANTGDLWTVGAGGNHDWALGMKSGTSPAITALTGGGFEVAFQANTGTLYTVGAAGAKNWGLGMDPSSSPGITGTPNNGYETAIQTNAHDLLAIGTVAQTDWKLGTMAGTSPAITTIGSSYEVAFQANTGNLWTVGAAGNQNWALGMKAGTSPALAAVNGGVQVAFQANTGGLWTVGAAGNQNWGVGMDGASSPAITTA